MQFTGAAVLKNPMASSSENFMEFFGMLEEPIPQTVAHFLNIIHWMGSNLAKFLS
jgi:hypothetical protein